MPGIVDDCAAIVFLTDMTWSYRSAGPFPIFDRTLILGVSVSALALAVEEAGLLSFVADNGPLLINLFGFLAVEPAKLAIPAVSF